MNLRVLACLGLLFFSAFGFAAKTVNLLDCFCDAAANDPTYQAQVAMYNANKQALPQSYAALLPQLTVTAGISDEYEYMGQLNSGVFLTSNYGLQANQTVFNYTQFKQLEQARFSVKSAFANLSGQQQDLMIRTAKAYFDVLQAHDILVFTEEQKKYISQQLSATRTLFEHNDATITDLEQADGAYNLIGAQYAAAQMSLNDAVQNLSEITGVVYEHFSYLNKNFPLIHPNPENLDKWVSKANQQNWFLRATRLDISAAREALAATQGGFLPTVTATAGFTNAVVPSLLLLDAVRNNTNTAGLNANWNVFQGGLTMAQVAVSNANLRQAEANMRKQFLQTMADTRKAYYNIVVGISRVKSVRASLDANTNALNHAQEAYRSGELTITEILQIQYQLYRAQTLYAEYVYNYLLEILLLKQAAGTLNVKSLALINSWLENKGHSLT